VYRSLVAPASDNYRHQVGLVSLTTPPWGNKVSSPAENRSEDFGRKSIYGPSHVRVVNLTDHEADSELLEACRGGDRVAFRQLYDLYKNRVYSMALYFFHGDRIAASDVTQQVFLKLLANIGQFRGEAVFSTWLYRLVVNACPDEARSCNPRAAAYERSRLEAVAGADSQESGYAQAQVAESVRAAVASLPPKFRIAVLLRYFDDLSYEEMAKALRERTV
jgi:RNA polymerase sigma-70 factor, ECF subfamily